MREKNPLISIIKPVNRHLLIVPHLTKESKQTESGVLLPDDFEQDEENAYIEATVVDVASDCSTQFKHLKYENINHNKRIIIDKSMLQLVKVKDRKFHLILENYVVGLCRETV